MSSLPDPAPSPWRWAFYASGLAMGAYGVWGELFGAGTDPRRWITLVVVAALGHDLVLAPLILLCAVLCRRMLPVGGRGVLQGAGLVSLVLVLIALPGIGRYGARADNSSVLPRDYGRGLVVALVAVAAVTTVLLVVRVFTRRPADGRR